MKHPPLYHVTFVSRLTTIAERGLLPVCVQPGQDFGASGIVVQKEGSVYLTCPEGIGYWYGRAVRCATARTQNILGDGYVPVVLRVRLAEWTELHVDVRGQKESGLPAWQIHETVPSRVIRMWTGKRWQMVGGMDASGGVQSGKLLSLPDNPLARPKLP